MRLASLLALLMATATLSGCLGFGGEDASSAGGDADRTTATDARGTDQAGAVALSDVVPVRFDTFDPVHEVRWFNGSFQTHQSADISGVTWMAGQPHPGYVENDLRDMVPAGRPVVITVLVEAATNDGDIDAWINMPGLEVWAADFHAPYGGHTSFEYIVVRDAASPIDLVLFYDELDTSTGFDYTMRVEVHSSPEIVPAGLPLAVDLPGAGTSLTFDLLGGSEEAAALVWGPDDVLVGRYELREDVTTITLPEGAEAGEYVYMFVQGSIGGRLNVSAPGLSDAMPRTLEQIAFFTGQIPVPAGATGHTITMEAPAAILQVGFGAGGGDVAHDFEGSLTGPEGPLLTAAIDGGPWVHVGFGFNTVMGAEGVVPGTYEISATWGQAVGASNEVTVSGWYVTFGR